MLANNGDPDQMPQYVASDITLHCLPMALLRVYRLEWVNSYNTGMNERRYLQSAELFPAVQPALKHC